MAKLKITVLERTFNREIAETYGSDDFKAGRGFGPCPSFIDGQVFVLDGLAKPGDFCSWAWSDIHREVRTVAFGGGYGRVATANAAITCCSNGMKPVVFKLERVDSSVAPELRGIPED